MIRFFVGIAILVITATYFIGIPVLYYLDKLTVSELLAFLGIIPLGLLAIFQEQFKNWWNAPKLTIEFDLKAPYCSRTPFYAFLEKGTVSTEAYYFRVKIINKGKTSAKFCEVVMTELLVETDNNWHEVNFFQQVNLRWDTGKTKDAYIALNPSPVGMLCDIGHISKQYEPTLFHLDYLYTIGGYQPSVLAPSAKYRFTLGVISENGKFVTRKFEFHWTGLWKDKDEEMFKEVTIKCI